MKSYKFIGLALIFYLSGFGLSYLGFSAADQADFQKNADQITLRNTDKNTKNHSDIYDEIPIDLSDWSENKGDITQAQEGFSFTDTPCIGFSYK